MSTFKREVQDFRLAYYAPNDDQIIVYYRLVDVFWAKNTHEMLVESFQVFESYT